MQKAIYANNGWILGICSNCGRLNYVEPHGTTAACKCSAASSTWTHHFSIPYHYRDTNAIRYTGPSRIDLDVLNNLKLESEMK